MSDSVDHYTTTRGESFISVLRPDVMLLKITGHLDRPMGTHVLDRATAVASTTKRLAIFCDWAEMSGYDSDMRSAFTHWTALHRNRVTLHLLVGSKIVAMGVSVANLALGGILVGHNNRTSFEAALRSTKMGLSAK